MQSNTHTYDVLTIGWRSIPAWKVSAKSTAWCLIGCAIGDFATIYAFQIWSPETSALLCYGIGNVQWHN